MGMGAQIIRPRLAFEREFGQHRNWWVRDPRICGNPLSIYLYLLSHQESMMPTQTQAQQDLGLGVSAWQSAKRRLLDAGFMMEVRDRYPSNYVDGEGKPRGGQKRFRLILADPVEGAVSDPAESVIEVNEPYEEYLAAVQELQCGKSAVAAETPDHAGYGKSAVAETPTADNPQSKENPQSFKEEKTKPSWLVGSLSENQTTNQTDHAREAAINAELDALHPDLSITLAQIRREVNDRVVLDGIDVVQAVRDTVIRAAARGSRVENPALYAAMAIVRNPGSWAIGVGPSQPFDPNSAMPAADAMQARDCESGDHWWGHEGIPELERAHCVKCDLPRRQVDPSFAALESQELESGGDR